MKNLFLILLVVALASCKKEQTSDTSLPEKIQLPQHSVDYFMFSDEEIEAYQTAFKQLKAPIFVEEDTEILLFPYTDWILTASVLKDKTYTNTDIENFLKYGGQLEKEQQQITKNEIATKEGFTLNTTKQILLDYFGEPKHSNLSDTTQHLQWEYSMKENTQATKALQPYLSNQLTFAVDAYFEQKKLKALIYAYQVK